MNETLEQKMFGKNAIRWCYICETSCYGDYCPECGAETSSKRMITEEDERKAQERFKQSIAVFSANSKRPFLDNDDEDEED